MRTTTRETVIEFLGRPFLRIVRQAASTGFDPQPARNKRGRFTSQRGDGNPFEMPPQDEDGFSNGR